MTHAGDSAPETPNEVRARRHPWAIVGLWGWQTALALVASWPAASLARAFFGASPRGDAELWDPGGHALLDFLWHGARALPSAATSVKVVLVVGAVAGLLPMAASMSALTYEARHRRRAGFVRCVTRAVRSMPALVLLLVIGTFAQAAALGLGFLVAKGVGLWFEASVGEALAQRLGIAVGLIFALVASGFGVVHDLARAVVVRSRVRAIRALACGVRAFGYAPLSTWWSWAWRALAALAPMLAVGLVAMRIGGRGGVALVLLAALHQAVVLSRVAFRLSWLARALRAVGDDERSSNPGAAPAV